MMLDQASLQSIKQRYGIIGNAQRLNYALTVAAQVASTDMTVLITGESGTGKESFSKIIHNQSPRKHNKFIAINCGAIPEGTIDSELFGHEKGAFTGAQESRKGYFEATNGGTIFLDEIGEMPIGTQSRLLRVLEYGEFIKVGASKVFKTDVRVVAATNVNLMEAVQKGKFREDLYYRLNSVPIFVPPLRDRGSDVELIFRKFATDFADRHRVKPIALTDEAKELLMAYRFPGNIRELKNIVEQMSLLVEEREIDATTLRSFLPSVSMLPALYKDAQGNDREFASGGAGFSERDLLYKVLFEMRHDMTELKKLVHRILQAGVMPAGVSDERSLPRRDRHHENYGRDLIREHEHLFSDMGEDEEINRNLPGGSGPAPGRTNGMPSRSGGAAHGMTNLELDERLASQRSAAQRSDASVDRDQQRTSQGGHFSNGNAPRKMEETDDTYDIIEDITHETEDDLSLEKKEKELIIKALRKNDSKRKYAANDLGISERTLYRKIKQYEIE